MADLWLLVVYIQYFINLTHYVLRGFGILPFNYLIRYFLRVAIVKRLSETSKERNIAVHTLSSYPDVNNSLKMEVGIEDSLHIEFEYNKAK